MMNKFTYNKKELTIAQSCILTLSILATGCSNANGNTSVSTSESIPTTSITSVETTIPVETTEVTETTINYDLNWDQYDSEVFDNYLIEIKGYNLVKYIFQFGYTDELNSVLTEYVNNKYSTDYDYIPFSEVNYFYRYIKANRQKYGVEDYDIFVMHFLNDEDLLSGSFKNKLILSYLVNNKIEYGSRVDISLFDNMYGRRIEPIDTKSYLYDYGLTNFGNDRNYRYSAELLTYALIIYNNSITVMTTDLGIKSGNVEDDPESHEMVNNYLNRYFGDNAPQIGEVITREQYIAIFGEEPIDLSYIPGAIVDQNSDSDESYSRSR